MRAIELNLQYCKEVGSIVYEVGYQPCLSKHGLNCSTKHLGVGSPTTWHGSTEVRIQGCGVITTEEDLLEDQLVPKKISRLLLAFEKA